MAADEVELQLGGIGRRDRDVRKPAEAGRYAIDSIARRELPVDEIAGALHALACRRGDPDPRAERRGLKGLERQMTPVEL